MQAADVAHLALLARDQPEALSRLQLARLDLGFGRGDGVRNDVLVGPDDGVAGGDLQALGHELHAFDAHGVRLSRGVHRRRPENERGGEHDPKKTFHGYFKDACRCLACSRCAAIAGRTFSIRPFSSAFVAFGTSTLSMASSTCWW